MRLKPVENPKAWSIRVAYWYSVRTFGKILMTLKVLYARQPRLLRPYLALLNSQEKMLSLPMPLRIMLKARIAGLNGCAFCVDIANCTATGDTLREKLKALDHYWTSSLFDRREQAALAFVEAATRHRQVSDVIFDALREHFNETEIVELTWLNATENFLNLTTVPLGIGSDDLRAVRKPQ
jgi:alkylhydroperoxidase family enzyme